MAGHQKTKRILELLDRLASEELDSDAPSALDYVCEWLADGKTLQQLAVRLTDLSSEKVHRSWLNKVALERLGPNAESRMNEARRRSGHALVEDAQATVDAVAADPTREGVAAAKLRADLLAWRAAKYDKATYGEAKTHNVQLNIGQLHLDALRKRPVAHAEISTQPTTQLVLASATLPSGQPE